MTRTDVDVQEVNEILCRSASFNSGKDRRVCSQSILKLEANARIPEEEIFSHNYHKTLDTAQPCHLLKPN